ncbi:sensor histidine kinase [Rhodohalobacter sp. SW132]|uniref:sensor histidine kinase n=1 Tax=Rhodohalobacter sp. SW132 TaxID=2293433 RepID=UPI000E27BE8E|nr:HAMP domain-containing sensor histidine kinase [Rhodohalobacter sp. SW132]REL38468.1 sensor histidine kinase [Rhodohalobacter sp. SW132]
MRSFYLKIAVIFSAILILFGLLVVTITMRASSDIAKEAIQKTNQDITAVLAKEFQPMLAKSFNQDEIEEKLTELSGKNPQFDFYLLSSTGYVKSVIPASKEKIALDQIALDTEPLDRFINGDPLPILASDPLNPDREKPFSAANISIMGSEGCYIYVVLEGDQFTQATAMITESYIMRGTLILLGVVFIISLVTGLFVFSNLTSRLEKIKKTVKGFERGQLNERIEVEGNDELSELSICFNRMADTLVENMKEIQKTDRLRRELVANVSHDLRSPIASIQGYLETIQMKGDTITRDELHNYFGTVLSNTKKLNSLIDGLFELSKLDAEEVTPNLEKISMAELIQDLVQQFRPIAEKREVTLEAQFPTNPNNLIEADIGLMSRALTNLIDNAIQHTPEGGKVTIATVESGQDFVIEISDTGCGISEEDLPHVFDRFYQADKSRSEKQGAGLGLAIAQKILHLHGAEVMVSSIENRGTTFRVALPGNGIPA